MTIANQANYRINGVINTDNNVLDNLDLLANAAGAFFTFDIHRGIWCVIINRPGDSVASFNDRNIIGSISVNGTGLTQFYNRVRVSYPHKDLADARDVSIYELPLEKWYPNELPNTLNLQYDIINDPLQAEAIALIQLKQSRLDKVIKFSTDFSMIGMKAGDIIDVTSSMYGYSAKKFRVIDIQEDDTDDGAIVLSITALEYDPGVYEFEQFTRYDKHPSNGIKNVKSNPAIQESDDDAWWNTLLRLAVPVVGSGLFNLLFGDKSIIFSPKIDEGVLVNAAEIDGPEYVCEGEVIMITVTYNCCVKDGAKIPYKITGTVNQDDIDFPMEGMIEFTDKTATVSIPTISDGVAEGTETLIFTVGGETGCTTHSVQIKDKICGPSTLSASPNSIQEGESSTVTINTTGLSNGAKVPYLISGTTELITSPETMTGEFTINSNTDSLTIETQDLNSTTNGSIVLTIYPGDDCCKQSVTITILGEYAPTPTDPVQGFDCANNYVEVPISWCAAYDSSGRLALLKPTDFIKVMKATEGRPSIGIPTNTIVTAGTPSTITPTATVYVDSDITTRTGVVTRVFTSFNNMSGGDRAVTGTTVQILGIPK